LDIRRFVPRKDGPPNPALNVRDRLLCCRVQGVVAEDPSDCGVQLVPPHAIVSSVIDGLQPPGGKNGHALAIQPLTHSVEQDVQVRRWFG
jgi:hypothetical protein